MSSESERGRRGERVAERYLIRRGWTILATRWRGAGGELDLIAARGDLVVAVEVKTRGNAAALVEPLTVAQRARIARATEAFVASRADLRERAVRIDLITVLPGRVRSRVRHVPGVVGG